MKMSNVKFLWASEEINKRSDEYWMIVMDIARKFPFARIKKCASIMGRKEEDDLGNYCNFSRRTATVPLHAMCGCLLS